MTRCWLHFLPTIWGLYAVTIAMLCFYRISREGHNDNLQRLAAARAGGAIAEPELEPPAARCPARADADSVARGAYLVSLLGCGRCHTEGYLTSDSAAGPHLAGSRIGIAYTAYHEDESTPGVVFAPNLTPDPDTGIGGWRRRDIVRAMTFGIGSDRHERLMVMPWPNYNVLTQDDLNAVADYLLSLDPVRREIPDPIPEGDAIDQPYVRFGVYLFEPAPAAPAVPAAD